MFDVKVISKSVFNSNLEWLVGYSVTSLQPACMMSNIHRRMKFVSGIRFHIWHHIQYQKYKVMKYRRFITMKKTGQNDGRSMK